ncbi:hypothetical protein RB531_720 [Salmonella enterica subsp. enterica serovar Typhimurium]
MKGRLISSDPYRQQFLVERAVSFRIVSVIAVN